ncbi:MAG: twin-arginine translocation pathway signal [Flavobacteriaceae bacterium]|nr:twin-arginine translocation pathway signal [Flavobacteriaceae bacterium]
MKRRDFLTKTSLASSLMLVPNFMKAFEGLDPAMLGYKKLVLIQLSGGNDGLNTIVPYRNDLYYKYRPGISISKYKVLDLNGELGMNENLAPLKSLFDKGYLSIINNVGYPNPNRSHFRSTDIWHTASSSSEYLDSGWMGRYIDQYGKKPHSGIEVDDSLSLIMKGQTMNGIATKDAKKMFNNAKTPFFNKVLENQTAAHLSEHNLGYLYKTMVSAQSSAKYIYETSKTSKSTKSYPKNPFAKQLKTTAEFINSGLETKVYYVSMGGFDTHASQSNRQSRLLKTYAEAIDVFVNDLEASNSFKDTLIVTFSEFGRRVQQNAAAGTDHGAASNLFIIGKQLKKPGFYNASPDLSNLDSNGDLKYSIDFRSVYATLLEHWLDANHSNILGQSFKTLNFI